MSSTCGNCDCADKSQCVKKGSSYTADIVETEKRAKVEEAFCKGSPPIATKSKRYYYEKDSARENNKEKKTIRFKAKNRRRIDLSSAA
ncbi:hypothetical protein GH714_025455 [Hevea brasiliensis]|uniref:Uncharacterized protein n=1 Tax=Hevea brasiliensis TaxID=3981 RepID=A0A6A6MP74_HEVBR|nr:hypothetical protein GH714_025455 [Hevea brasiliensis]